MKTKQLMKLAILLLCLTAGSTAQVIEITKVIEIGPASDVPMLGPMRWSPDGTKLAYISGGRLMYSDTLGNSQEVTPLEWRPRRLEWLDNQSVVINSVKNFGRDSTLFRLGTFDIATGQESIVAKYTRTRDCRYKPGHSAFDGPFHTLGGNIYYSFGASNGKRGPIDQERRWLTADDGAAKLEDDHVMIWGSDGLYDISLGSDDSVRVIERVGQTRPTFTSVNRDRTKVIYGGEITSLPGGNRLSLYDRLDERPAGTYVCGFVYTSFHPTKNEVLFQLTCDDGVSYIVDAIGVYDMDTDRLVILDNMLEKTGCAAPLYSPDGSKISFLSEGRAYIIYRGGE